MADVIELSVVDGATRQIIVAHYQRAAKAIVATAGQTPMISVSAPNGLDEAATRVGQLHKATPAHLETVAVETRSGTHPYLRFAEHAVLWRAHAYAAGFEGWMPMATDPLKAAFARVLIEPAGACTRAARCQPQRGRCGETCSVSAPTRSCSSSRPSLRFR